LDHIAVFLVGFPGWKIGTEDMGAAGQSLFEPAFLLPEPLVDPCADVVAFAH